MIANIVIYLTIATVFYQIGKVTGNFEMSNEIIRFFKKIVEKDDYE